MPRPNFESYVSVAYNTTSGESRFRVARNPFNKKCINNLNDSKGSVMLLKNFETQVAQQDARYRDIDLNFKRHPSSGDVTARVDSNAVAQSLRTIVLTTPGDLDEEPDFGVGVWGLLGENMTPASILILKERVIEQCSLYEPRAEISDVVLSHDMENYTIRIRIFYMIANVDQMEDVTVSVSRVL